jgi:predicted DNA-binding transcriptional regulator AlpA
VAKVLTSWKEIAQYLGKSSRTAQRWERELGLPVRGKREGSKRSVIAVPREIDAWVRSLPRLAVEHSSGSHEDLLRMIESLQSENATLRNRLKSLPRNHSRDSFNPPEKGCR